MTALELKVKINLFLLRQIQNNLRWI